MQDVDGGLALHPGLDGEPGEVVRCFADIVPGELHGDGAVLDLTEEHDSAGLHAGPVAHGLGDDDLTLGADLRRPDTVQRDPITYHVQPPVALSMDGTTIIDRYDLLRSYLDIGYVGVNYHTLAAFRVEQADVGSRWS